MNALRRSVISVKHLSFQGHPRGCILTRTISCCHHPLTYFSYKSKTAVYRPKYDYNSVSRQYTQVQFELPTISNIVHRYRSDDKIRNHLKDPKALFIMYDKDLRVNLHTNTDKKSMQIRFFMKHEFESLIKTETPVFLGVDDKNTPLFAIRTDADSDFFEKHFNTHMRDLRMVIHRMEELYVELAGYGRQLLEFSTSKYCTLCSGVLEPVLGGSKRVCNDCNKEYYPKIEPVAIVLITTPRLDDGKRYCLVARQPFWPPKMYSCLAGFVESGESLEEAVTREVFEEVGISCVRNSEFMYNNSSSDSDEHVEANMQYLGSQPWAFPHSLMVGFYLELQHQKSLDTLPPIVLDNEELEDAFWMSATDVRKYLSPSPNKDNLIRFPPPQAIAHSLLRNWADAQVQPSPYHYFIK